MRGSTNRGWKRKLRPLRRRPGRKFLVLMMLSLTGPTLRPAEVPNRQEIATWIGPESTFTKDEVVGIVQDLMGIALEEIENASRQTGREMASEGAAESAYYKTLAEKRLERIRNLEKEITRMRRWSWFFGGTAAAMTATAGIGFLMH